ncbi:13792_t:CDS:2, partial [Cetraspora pellucida]
EEDQQESDSDNDLYATDEQIKEMKEIVVQSTIQFSKQSSTDITEQTIISEESLSILLTQSHTEAFQIFEEMEITSSTSMSINETGE